MNFKLILKLYALLFSAFAAFTVEMPVSKSAEKSSAYLFTYFTGNSVPEELIRFAVSEDGLKSLLS